MGVFLARRLLLLIPTILIVAIIIFLLLRLFPGDILDIMTSEYSYAPNLEAMKHMLGLDKPLYQQLGEWLINILGGNLGKSLWSKQPVSAEVFSLLPMTLELCFLAFIFACIVGLPIGVLAAIRQDTLWDYVTRSLAILTIAIPNFWLGTMLIIFPSVWWSWSPPVRYASLLENPLANLFQLLIPAIVLGARPMGALMRMTRAMMLEVLRQDYVRTAWSKGLRENVIIYRHALKNAMIPVISVMGLQIPFLIGSSIVVETIFGLPGIGSTMLRVVVIRDYPMVQAIALFFAICTVVANLAVDLTYGFLDPRVRFQ